MDFLWFASLMMIVSLIEISQWNLFIYFLNWIIVYLVIEKEKKLSIDTRRMRVLFLFFFRIAFDDLRGWPAALFLRSIGALSGAKWRNREGRSADSDRLLPFQRIHLTTDLNLFISFFISSNENKIKNSEICRVN